MHVLDLLLRRWQGLKTDKESFYCTFAMAYYTNCKYVTEFFCQTVLFKILKAVVLYLSICQCSSMTTSLM